MIKTFKGLISHDSVKQIRLKTNNGLIGYKVKKLVLFPAGAQNSGGFNYTYKACVGVYSADPSDPITPASSNNYRMMNFDSPTLLAAAFYSQASGADTNPEDSIVVLDDKKINRDIYVTYFNVGANDVPINYYIEIERMKLDMNEATVATLKDMRGRE